jgi:3-oxoacyl-[acyl-carrier protein] reductase
MARAAIITSASRGLGAAVAERLAKDGFSVVVNYAGSEAEADRKKGLVAALVEKLGEVRIDPNDIMVLFLETDRTSGSFGGGRLAPPVAFA